MNVSILRSFSAFTKTLTVCYTPEMDAGQFFFSQPNPWMIPTQLNPDDGWMAAAHVNLCYKRLSRFTLNAYSL